MDRRVQKLLDRIAALDADYARGLVAAIQDLDMHSVIYLSDPPPAVQAAQAAARELNMAELRKQHRSARDDKLEQLRRDVEAVAAQIGGELGDIRHEIVLRRLAPLDPDKLQTAQAALGECRSFADVQRLYSESTSDPEFMRALERNVTSWAADKTDIDAASAMLLANSGDRRVAGELQSVIDSAESDIYAARSAAQNKQTLAEATTFLGTFGFKGDPYSRLEMADTAPREPAKVSA